MHGFATELLLSSTILIPAITGIARFRLLHPDFYAFVLTVWIGLINEMLSIVLAYTIKNNSVNSNIYVLIEFALIIYQFYRWSNIAVKYVITGIGGLAVWIADNIILHRIDDDNSLFRIFSSFIILFLSIDQINKLLIFERENVLKNATFLICITFVGYFSCKAFIEVFNVFYTGLSHEFRRNVFMILYAANFISNIMYTIAILCIPSKKEFTLPY